MLDSHPGVGQLYGEERGWGSGGGNRARGELQIASKLRVWGLPWWANGKNLYSESRGPRFDPRTGG